MSRKFGCCHQKAMPLPTFTIMEALEWLSMIGRMGTRGVPAFPTLRPEVKASYTMPPAAINHATSR